MAVKRAKILAKEHFEAALADAREHSQSALRDELFLLFSRLCGMRAQEIASIHVEDLTDAAGALGDEVFVSSRGAKGGRRYGKDRTIPMHPDLRKRLALFLRLTNRRSGPLFTNRFGDPMSANGVAQQLIRIYQRAGLQGCSSHSGRRSFITQAARAIGKVGDMSLVDVQRLAGHSYLDTTAGYIEGAAADRKLINLIGYD